MAVILHGPALIEGAVPARPHAKMPDMTRATTSADTSAHSLLGLEVLRFVCAVSVLIWHYQHFYVQGSELVGFDAKAQPLYNWLKPFYEAGWLGVQAFWALSGFIFFWKYAQPVSQGLVSARRFAVLRFTRLYPLHLLTLLVVCALIPWYRHLHGVDYVYRYNDAWHFMLQLFMASDWPGRSEWSFNGPIWSISIEVLVYALFFALSRLGLTRWWQALGLILASGAVYGLKLTPHPIVLCVFFFYLGALTQLGHAALQRQSRARQNTALGLCLLVMALGIALLCTGLLRPMFFVAMVTPAGLLVLLDRVRTRSTTLQHAINALGNTTYASYLLHFPLQLLLACISGAWSVQLPVNQPWWLLAWLVAVFGLASLVYRTVEMPAQAWLRQRLDRR